MQKLAFCALALLLACKSQQGEATAQAAGSGATAPSSSAESLPAGVDLSKLDENGRKIFFRVVQKSASVCGKAQSLLQSAKQDPSCRRSLFAIRYAARLVGDGFLESEIEERLDKRYMQKPVKLDVAAAPSKGDAKASVLIVEFADFECPHCKMTQPILDRLLDEYKGQVRVVFKHFPLKNHSNAEVAANAAVAAHKQGKFWPYVAKVWKNQEALGPSDLERYAQEAGLDVKKWKQDFESPLVKEQVAKDRHEGDALGILGTPVIYINGREWIDTNKDYDSLREWVEEELAVTR